MRKRGERHHDKSGVLGAQKAGATVKAPKAKDDGRVHVGHPLPHKPSELVWRDYLILLLHVAAELEHSLMVQYLYAAYSLGGPQARKHEAAVNRWRAAILGVAKEEMGHLMTVQNLLCLMGGPISFERDDYPWDTVYYPFAFCLEPLTPHSLAKYVFAEMPPDIRDDEGEDGRTARDAMRLLKIGSGHPVGEVYDLIIRIIGDEQLIPDADFNPDSYGVQATFDDWGRNYRPGPFTPHPAPGASQPRDRETRLIIARMATRTEALAALRDVAGQGEAPQHRLTSNTEPSHFDRFATIFRELKQIHKKDPRWSPARRVPTNPVVSHGTRIPGVTNIEAAASGIWANLFNVRYRMLLTYLTHTYRLPRRTNGEANGLFAAVIGNIFGEMYNLKTLAGILVQLPLKRGGKGAERAAPPFEMPYTLTLPNADIDCWKHHRALVGASKNLTDALLDKSKANLTDAPDGASAYLRTLRQLDDDSIALIDQVIIGLRPIKRSRT